jgi:ferredoxin-NADP reductase/ferredoxin
MSQAINLLLNGKIYNCQSGETVLDALLRQKVTVPYACLKQSCMSCMMQSLNGPPPLESQRNLKETLQLQNNFLACGCIPNQDMEICLNQEKLTTQVSAQVIEMNRLNQSILELVLQCETAVDFHGGQSVLLLNYEHIGKRFPIASPSSAKSSGKIEVHVERIPGAAFSAWLHDRLRIGDKLHVCGINGEMYYLAGEETRPLLLISWNGGLGAQIGVVQDIFENNHVGPVYLFHCVADSGQLYFQAELNEISQYFPNFHYIHFVQQGTVLNQGYQSDLAKTIAQILPDLTNWKVFLCGNKAQTHAIQRYAYLAGADMKDIYLEITTL